MLWFDLIDVTYFILGIIIGAIVMEVINSDEE